MSVADLWRQVAETPEDLAVRRVLADALLDAGDDRGELIHLQCGSDEQREASHRRIEQLIVDHWARSFDDLARVLEPSRCVFRGGMLATVAVGQRTTPPEAYAKVRGHRELACVREVRPHHVDPEVYATFVDGLLHEPYSLEADDPGLVALARRRTPRGIRCLRYAARLGWPLRVDYLDLMFPELERFELLPCDPGISSMRGLVAAIVGLPAVFPRLEAIAIYESGQLETRLGGGALDALRAMPIVELR